MNLLQRIIAAFKGENPAERVPSPGMDRRAFLRVLGQSAAVAAVAPALDLDKLLWLPGGETASRTGLVELVEAPPIVVVPAMGRNIFLTPEFITREVLKVLEHSMKLTSIVNREYDGRYSLLVNKNPVVSIPNPKWGRDTVGDWQDRIEAEVRANARLSDASLPVGALTNRTLHVDTSTSRMNAAINGAEGIMAFQLLTKQREPATIVITDADLSKTRAPLALTDHKPEPVVELADPDIDWWDDGDDE